MIFWNDATRLYAHLTVQYTIYYALKCAYVIVITWARVICLKYTHEHEGPSASVYI